jgi:RNA ligase
MAILRECRGLIFDTATGKVIARRLHKFFNVNEREETQVGKVDFSEPHVILEKLDGSMITPVWTTQGLRWGTKMGVTMVALPVEEYLADHWEYAEFAELCKHNGVTPIFEWCSRKQTIVIDYAVDQLVLIAVRSNVTGEYMGYERMVEMLKGVNIPVVKAYEGTAANMQALIDQVGPMVGLEGFVVRFESGHMVKIKASDYVRKHKAKDMIGREKNIIELLVTEKMDDVKPFLDAADLARVNEFEKQFWNGVKDTGVDLLLLREYAATHGLDVDRKTFANDFVKTLAPVVARFMYKMFDKTEDPIELLKTAISQSCGTQVKIDEARWMFKCNWNGNAVEE